MTIHPCNTITPHNFLLSSFSIVNLQLTICMQFKYSFSIIIIFICNCHHIATDSLHDYIHFTIYHLELHFRCSEAQTISAISPKTCTLNLQLLHKTKRPTKWSGHVKMIDLPRELLLTRAFTQEGNYLVSNCHHIATDHLHDYIHFTIYCLELHFQCSEAQEISAISPKTCTLKLQLFHNTKRPTKWSGHVKMIDPLENFYIWKTFYPIG